MNIPARDMPDRIPARKLSDITLPADTYNADFQLTDRYQAFSTELIRLSLLGIAGYGFLIANVVLKSDENLNILAGQSMALGAGVVFLGLTTALALAHRFFSTGCLAYQISILRTLTRLDGSHWTAEEREASQLPPPEAVACQLFALEGALFVHFPITQTVSSGESRFLVHAPLASARTGGSALRPARPC